MAAVPAGRRWKRGALDGCRNTKPNDVARCRELFKVSQNLWPGAFHGLGNLSTTTARSSAFASPANPDPAAVGSGVSQKQATLKGRRKREAVVHDESDADPKPDKSIHRRKRHKQGIASDPGSVSPQALALFRSACWPRGGCPELVMFLKLPEAHQQMLRRSIRKATIRILRSFQQHHVISICGEEHVWPIDPVQQTHVLRRVTFKLYELCASHRLTCPLRNLAALEWLFKALEKDGEVGSSGAPGP